MNHLPDIGNGTGPLLSIYKSALNFQPLSQVLCFTKVLFSLWVIKIGINDFEHAGPSTRSALTYVKKHYRVAISFVDSGTYDSIILSIISCKYSHDGTGQTTFDTCSY